MEKTTKSTWSTSALLQSFWFIAAFTFISGYVNSYSFIVRGGVFAVNQTGNAAVFAKAIFLRDTTLMLDALWPMLATIAGAFIAEYVLNRYRNHSEGTWQMRVLYWEIPAFLIVGLIPLTAPHALPNVMLSLIAGFQLSAFRTYNGWAFNSTVQTGNLRSMGMYLYQALFVERKRAFSRKTFGFFMLLGVFIFGGIAGAFFSYWWGIRAIWGNLPILIALAVAQYYFVVRNGQRQPTQ